MRRITKNKKDEELFFYSTIVACNTINNLLNTLMTTSSNPMKSPAYQWCVDSVVYVICDQNIGSVQVYRKRFVFVQQ